MGLNKFLHKVGEKVKSYPGEKFKDYQAERAHQREQKLEYRNQYEKGYSEGQYKRGVAEGSGKVVEQKRYNGKTQGITGRVGQTARGVNQGLKSYGDVFLGGGSSKQGYSGGGLGIGFFSEEPKRPPPMRTTTFNPRTGKVTTVEPIQEKREREDMDDPFGSFWGEEHHRGKKEKHPYDLF